MVATTAEMNHRDRLLVGHAILVSDDVPMRVSTRDEVREIILQHFGIRKDQFYVTRSSPEPFIIYFHETHARDVVFAAGRVVEGPMELGFHAWDLDRQGDRELIPFHVKLSVEGIPSHAWFKEIAALILGDEAMIRHVEEDTIRRVDMRAF
jgi:hypothetical protein